MKIIIKDVGYNRGYVIGPYLQERPGVNADVVVEEGEDQEECALKALRYLKSITNRFHKEDNPHLYQEDSDIVKAAKGTFNAGDRVPLQWSTTPSIDYVAKEKLEIAIDNADSLETLSTLKEEASKHGLVGQYMNKLKELTA